jgi:hypothetical protein
MDGEMNDDDLQKDLDACDHDPAREMARMPVKRDATGAVVERPFTAFSQCDLGDGDFVLHRDTVRKQFGTVVDGVYISLEDSIPGRSMIEDGDRPENLVDTLKFVDLAAMDQAGLLKVALPDKSQPWSDDYWADYLGCLGRRYADPAFPRSKSWHMNHDYIHQHPVAAIVSQGGDGIDLLSPAEKYDVLVGDTTGCLTAAMWARGDSSYHAAGRVETWMGICDGWAAASYMLPRPTKLVTVRAANGGPKITFYPADIKALASLLWASANTVTRFIGHRCTEKKPPTDANGRVLSQDAFDPNPGTWHMAVVNQLGVAGRSLVMDATYDYEVWNQPVAGYEYRYFNPQTMRLVPTLKDATVTRSAYTRDRFEKYRSPNAASYVGIVMRVRYMIETDPMHWSSDGPSFDNANTVTYKYDIELDAADRIIGGEWFTGKTHPDFLWTPPPKARAISPAESMATGAWHARKPLPDSWRRAGMTAAGQGMPLAKIVEALIQFANE